MEELNIRSLKNTTVKQITDCFNLAFSDYSLPIRFTEAQFENKFSSESIRLDLSVGAFDGDFLIGFILHFMDVRNGEKYIYNGGTGVVAEYRGSRLTTRMYDYIIPILKQNYVDKMVLEVFTDNTPAIKIYQHRGFRILRELNCFKGILKLGDTIDEAQYQIVELDVLDWELLQSFWDSEPTWQSSISTINNIEAKVLSIGVYKQKLLVGYMIYLPTSRRILQLAIDKNYRRIGLGSLLLNYICHAENEDISFINIDTKISGMKFLLEHRGLENYINQYEMGLLL